MITEILLGLTAMLLGLFCLLYRRGERRNIHFADAGEMLALLKNRHAVFQTVLGALVLASAASAGDLLAQYVHAPAGLRSVLHLCRLLLGGVFFLSFAFYAVKLLSFERSPSRSVRAAALLPTVLAVLGAAVQIVFSVRVALFFAAVALFVCLLLYECGSELSVRGVSYRRGLIAAIALTFLAVIAMNAVLILNFSNAQSEEIGDIQLDIIRSDLQDTIIDAETDVLRVAIGAEQHLDSDPSRETLRDYIREQRDSFLQSSSFMNLYVAGSDWHIIPDFDAPADFHASERVWYLGAMDNPGEVYISEPYILVYSDDRADFASDVVFANFRPVTEGKLYRSASPIDNKANRAHYADDLIQETGVQTVMNMADTPENIVAFIAAEDYDSPYYRELFENGRVFARQMAIDFTSATFAEGIVKGFSFLAEGDMPYLVHCLEGKDRTGFAIMVLEALMGWNEAQIVADYMQTYTNYYGIEAGTEKFNLILEKNIMEMLCIMAGLEPGTSLAEIDLKAASETYLLNNGMDEKT